MTTNKNILAENQTAVQQYPLVEDEEGVNLLDILIVLVKHKRIIIGMTLAAALISTVISLLLPNIYTGTTRILPPQQSQSSASTILKQLGGIAGVTGGALGIKNPSDLYIAMLKSRTILERIVQRFDLQKVYDTKSMADTIRLLDRRVKAISGTDGLIILSVDDKDPKRAANMANAFIADLDKLMQTFSLTDASHRRLFFQQQLKGAKDKLTDAELLLDRTPNTSLHYLDVLRNMKYRESIYEILAKQYEMAKLDEAKDYPLIQILDKAIAPESKSKPKRGLIILLSTLISGFMGIVWAFIKEANEKAKANPQYMERLRIFRRYLLG